MRKRSKNLLLSENVLFLAEEYCRHFHIPLSRLVEDHLKTLPISYSSDRDKGSPVVARLRSTAHRFDMEDESYLSFVYGRWGRSE